MDNKQSNDEGLRELALFAGAGGGILGGKLLGWETVCAVEYNAYARSVLLARQNDRTLAPFPIWDDVRTFDGKPWRGIVDVVSGGFPCQDISRAGKGAGISGERSGLWSEMARVICEVRPQYAFMENSAMLTNRGLGTVLADLSKMGFNAKWGVISAAEVGANHQRERIWILASNSSNKRNRWGKQQQKIAQEKNGNACNSDSYIKSRFSINDETQKLQKFSNGDASDSNLSQCERRSLSIGIPKKYAFPGNSRWWENIPEFYGMDDGLANRMDRLKAIGNGQVPLCAATAWKILNETKQ